MCAITKLYRKSSLKRNKEKSNPENDVLLTLMLSTRTQSNLDNLSKCAFRLPVLLAEQIDIQSYVSLTEPETFNFISKFAL